MLSIEWDFGNDNIIGNIKGNFDCNNKHPMNSNKVIDAINIIIMILEVIKPQIIIVKA